MKKKLFAYTLLPVLGLSLLAGASLTSANGFFFSATPDEIATHHQEMFQSQAQLLGVTTEEVKAAWAEGKTLQDLAKEKGMTDEEFQQKMKDARTAQMKNNLQTLVSKGVITQSQADSRLEVMQQKSQSGASRMGKGFHRGFGL